MYYFYWLPMGTDAKVRGVPWITWLILVANVLVFAALHALPGAEVAAYRFAFKAGQPTIQTAIGSLFLHAGSLEFLINVLFLACFGPPLESRVGPARFLIGFVGLGWLSNLAHAGWIAYLTPDMGTLPIVGAAGAISGLMGVFLVRLPFAHIQLASLRLLFTQGVFRPGRRTFPGVAAVFAWFGLQGWISLHDPVPEAALLGHLAALTMGMILGWGMGLAPEGRLESLLASGSRLAARGDWFAALGEYDAYLAAVPDHPEVLVQAARIERVLHQEPSAIEHFQLAIHLWLREPDPRKACAAYDEMKRLFGAVTLPPKDLLRVARACEVLGRPADASRAYEEFGRRYPERAGSAVALLKSAEIETDALHNPARARSLYHELLQRPLTPEIERLVQQRAGESEPPLVPAQSSTAREETPA
jgi:membrane associated rhomboid family serine protease